MSISSEAGISLYRFAILIAALKLETKGLTRHGQSAYSILKAERGYKGNKVKVLALAQADYDKEKTAYMNDGR